MSEKVYIQEQWVFEVSLRGWLLQPSGYYEVATVPDTTGWKFLSTQEAIKLIPELENQGLIKPRLDERLRTEDLKITHRLFDLLDKTIGK